MKQIRLFGLALIALLAMPAWGEEADPGSPHHMMKPNGEADTEKCGLCHNEDFSLSRSKLETCTLCHATTTHAGAAQHLAAPAAAVAQRRPKDSPLPVTDEGAMYCGTCHIFHDPKVSGEEILAQRWLPRDSGLSQAVRESLSERWAKTAQAENAVGAKFSTRGTTRLRLPIEDGSLCRQCHDYGNEKAE